MPRGDKGEKTKVVEYDALLRTVETQMVMVCRSIPFLKTQHF
jgi:hypothetical protein